jgi:hypothetical protein
MGSHKNRVPVVPGTPRILSKGGVHGQWSFPEFTGGSPMLIINKMFLVKTNECL